MISGCVSSDIWGMAVIVLVAMFQAPIISGFDCEVCLR